MAKRPTFNFGYNKKPSKQKSGTAKKKTGGSGSKSNAWRKYASGPIPD